MKKIKQENGFTIMEVLVAVVILTMSLLLLLNMAMVGLDGNDWSNRATQSTQILQQKLEEFRTGNNALADGIDTVNSIERNWTVTNAASHLYRVDIQASWRNRGGDLLHNDITAYIRTDSL
jgi:prepilin-type N-terminal cleavage/methylation domain-containing protein